VKHKLSLQEEALANPVPEIMPHEAKKAGAFIVAIFDPRVVKTIASVIR
jgi:Asp/Glu/hydantoin racemase